MSERPCGRSLGAAVLGVLLMLSWSGSGSALGQVNPDDPSEETPSNPAQEIPAAESEPEGASPSEKEPERRIFKRIGPQPMRELLRAVEQEGDQRAEFAVALFCYRVRKYLGAYLAVLGGADAIVFGGGIGENAPEVRKRICRNMEWCGMSLHPDRNRTAVGLSAGSAGKISTDDSRVAVYVVAADEETWPFPNLCVSCSTRRIWDGIRPGT